MILYICNALSTRSVFVMYTLYGTLFYYWLEQMDAFYVYQ